MSGYGKNQEQYVYDAAATRPDQVPPYTGYAQPSFASQYTDPQARLPHGPSSAELPFIPSSTAESRAEGSYQTEFPFIDARSRHLADTPELLDTVTPVQGTAASKILLHLRAKYDLTTDASRFVFMFGSKACVAALQKIDQVGEYYNYTLSVDAPPFSSTQCLNPTMMLQLRMEDNNGRTLSEAQCGSFTYTGVVSSNMGYKSSPDLTRKRKYSTEFGDYSDTSVSKRPSIQRLQAKPRSISNSYPLAQSNVSPLPSYVQPSLPADYGYSGGYSLSKQQTNYTPQLPHKGLYAVPSGISLPQTDMKGHSPNLTPYQYSLGQNLRSPASVSATPVRSSVIPSPGTMSTPALIRTSSLQPPNSGNATSGQSFNPYLMYPSKAILRIEGDLEKMSEGWTREEFDAKRRLVQFKRSQSGSTITTSFAPVTPEARSPNSICVSCILWEEKQECFITSVDTIFLLEALVNARFTVEEKNRIRRNLEGFHPLTVSKAKADSEEFFKIIMAFPNPKPRNIEKDVKVFPWKSLAHALKKIISKYSASYSSTAGALPAPISSSYSTNPRTQAALDAHRNTSPRSVASSAASTAYTPSLTSTTLSPNMRASAGLEGSAGMDPTGHSMSQWTTSSHHQVPQYSTGLGTTGRGSWDYGAYLDPTPATAVPSAAQSLQLQRSDVTTDLSQMAGDNSSYEPYGQRTTRV
ncbi:hypothetical protein GQ43DRAFT_475351 [Delitschia confertaspora ATCC 74209]|uniref:DUF7082 domain-containing protein n=1 Tax=Delitschia confertaspora ATCC 74209 TaxID=1513339 RepID=A0A9P4JJA7_9PLEO|nr:hypothetical protein GQ43DRAFT_475351 [Delitschia confertaspora ATCC 74209]